MSDYPINGKSFSDDLKFWRAEKPDEWVMDRFIREAARLEAETARLQEIERNVDLVTQQWQQRVQELEKEVKDKVDMITSLDRKLEMIGVALEGGKER